MLTTCSNPLKEPIYINRTELMNLAKLDKHISYLKTILHYILLSSFSLFRDNYSKKLSQLEIQSFYKINC